MTDANLVDRLAALPNLAEIPRAELEWLAENGELESPEAGTVLAHKGKPVGKLWIILSGQVAVRVDRGAGPRQIMGWGAGEVTGMLPYSRMTGPPGDNCVKEAGEILAVARDKFPEMIACCPAFTAYTVHLMLDRARRFNTSDMQDEKMISLGKLSAGLAHELNNPSSAIVRAAKLLSASLSEADASCRALGTAGAGEELFDALDRVRATASTTSPLSSLELSRREQELADWLDDHGADPSHAAPLAEAAVSVEALESLAALATGATLSAALRHLAANVTTTALAGDVERAGARIHELVGAVKRFTYMDRMAGQEPVDVEIGLRDTVRMLSAKAKAKGAVITLSLDADLPRVLAAGGELNQVWMNLFDNALDAIGESGRIEVTGTRELDQVVIRVIDNGCGIPEDALPRIFDPFFTTKPPGEGTGLGLDIARRLARQNQGDIAVASRPGWTEFRVSLRAVTPERTVSAPPGTDA